MNRLYTTYYLVLFLSVALFSCQSNGSRQDTTGEQPPLQPAPPTSEGVINYAGQLPDVIDYEGQFLQAAQWPGQGSSFYILVSKFEQGEFFSPSWISRLNIYLFEIGGGQIVTRRAFKAEAPNTYSTVELKGGQSQLINLPSLGTAFSIVYSICPDGEDPCSIFSSVIGADGKYDFQVLEDVEKAVYLEAQETMMAGIPNDVRQHMLEQLFGKD